jgi:hypothetical protein
VIKIPLLRSRFFFPNLSPARPSYLEPIPGTGTYFTFLLNIFISWSLKNIFDLDILVSQIV